LLQLPAEYNPEEVVIEETNLDGIPELILQFDAERFRNPVRRQKLVRIPLTGEIADRTWFRN